MIIRKLEKSDECQAKELWKSCFGDSDAFIDAYFKNKVDYNHSLGMFIGDELVCDLFMLDVDFVYNGKAYKSGFLAGCATKKEYRNRGYMKTLLMRQLEIMKNGGYALCFLHPFLHDFYRKFGWETVSYVSYKQAEKTDVVHLAAEEFTEKDILDAYNRRIENAGACFRRNEKDIANKLAELYADGGKVFFSGGNYALYFENEDSIEIQEHSCKTSDEAKCLSESIAFITKKTADYFVSDKNGDSEYTMVRIVDINAVNDIAGEFIAGSSLKDDFCYWNNIYSGDNTIGISEVTKKMCEKIVSDGSVFFDQY